MSGRYTHGDCLTQKTPRVDSSRDCTRTSQPTTGPLPLAAPPGRPAPERDAPARRLIVQSVTSCCGRHTSSDGGNRVDCTRTSEHCISLPKRVVWGERVGFEASMYPSILSITWSVLAPACEVHCPWPSPVSEVCPQRRAPQPPRTSCILSLQKASVRVQKGKKGLCVSVQEGAVHELQETASSPYRKVDFVYRRQEGTMCVSAQEGAVHELQETASSPYIKLDFVYRSARRDYEDAVQEGTVHM